MSVTTSIYVAGASAEIDRAEWAMRELRAAGFVITLDWTETIRKVGHANPMDASASQRADWARADLFAAARADIFWLLMPKAQTIGAWVEFGAASIAIPRPLILVSGPDASRTIFTALAFAVTDLDGTTLDYIKGRFGAVRE